MSDIEIVFLTFNRLDLNKQSLPALLESDPDIDYKVHICDNGSTDGTVEWLKELDHPKIGDITFNDTNLGISPVTNRFWKKTNATYIGKIDNDIIVPKNWIKEVMLRQQDAQRDLMGPVTLYHWIDCWSDDIELDRAPIVTCSNGSKIIRSSHTGGNYIFHRYLLDLLGSHVSETSGLKGGFTAWQAQKSRFINCGYIYPLQFFRLPELYKSWDGYVSGRSPQHSRDWIERERREAKRLLELPF